MLQRVLEPEVMDSPEEASNYDAMDHHVVNQQFVADFLAVWDGQDPILDVGSGTAQIPIEFCRQSAHGSIIGIDLAEHMLQLGRKNIDEAGFAARIRLELANARSLPYDAGSFPAVISNSIIHHIPEPYVALAEMARVVMPEGTLFIRDLLRPIDEASLHILVDTYAGEANDHQRQMFRNSLRAALNTAEVQSMVARLGFDPDGVQQTSDRHWTWVGRR